jgi:hypothetical protein
MSQPDAGTVLFGLKAKTVDVSSADFDCTTNFSAGFAIKIYVGTSAPSDVAVMHYGDTVAVTFKNVPQGTELVGVFKTILHTGTTASNLVARGY